jgi:hypothetical protein
MHGSLAKILDSGNASEKRSATVFTSLQAASTERVATVSAVLTVGFSHARYPSGNRT